VDDLYGRDAELEKMDRALRNREWVSVLGPRMVGKTSLAKAIMNRYRDMGWEAVYVDLKGVKNSRELFVRLYSKMPKGTTEGVLKALSLVKVTFRGASVEFNKGSQPLKALDYLLRNLPKKKMVIVLDEFQDVVYGVNRLMDILHNLMMDSPDLSFIFTGSAIGLMRMLDEPEGDAPLAGRSPLRVVLKPWDERTSKAYLREGLRECGADGEGEIADAIANLGTMTGWVNYYGRGRCNSSHEQALRDAIKEAKKVAKNEITNVIGGNEWRMVALKMMANETTYGEIINETNVSDRSLSNFLDRLERMYLIEKNGRNYSVADKMYRAAIKEI
jgi:hypothetical protein